MPLWCVTAWIGNENHFFFECRSYFKIRVDLFNTLRWLPDACTIDIKLLTKGSKDFST